MELPFIGENRSRFLENADEIKAFFDSTSSDFQQILILVKEFFWMKKKIKGCQGEENERICYELMKKWYQDSTGEE